MSLTSFITGIITWLACCLLLGYMGQNRKSGYLRSFLLPVFIGLILYAILWVIDLKSWLLSYDILHSDSYRFLISFVLSLLVGYALVKLSPKTDS
jgi:hypothetical protein